MLHLLTMPVVLRKFAGYVDTDKKAVIDRTLRPRCCHLIRLQKVDTCVRCLQLVGYYSAQFIAKPKAACALHFSWAATCSNLGL